MKNTFRGLLLSLSLPAVAVFAVSDSTSFTVTSGDEEDNIEQTYQVSQISADEYSLVLDQASESGTRYHFQCTQKKMTAFLTLSSSLPTDKSLKLHLTLTNLNGLVTPLERTELDEDRTRFKSYPFALSEVRALFVESKSKIDGSVDGTDFELDGGESFNLVLLRNLLKKDADLEAACG